MYVRRCVFVGLEKGSTKDDEDGRLRGDHGGLIGAMFITSGWSLEILELAVELLWN